jgi:four helix bundle protein
MMGKNFEDLMVWQKSVGFAADVYSMTAAFPAEEKYGLTSQIRRASVSVASNIAEGSARDTDKEFIRFLYIARGSRAEAKTQLIIAQRIGFISKNDVDTMVARIDELSRMISGLRKSMEPRDSRRMTRDFTLVENTGV